MTTVRIVDHIGAALWRASVAIAKTNLRLRDGLKAAPGWRLRRGSMASFRQLRLPVTPHRSSCTASQLPVAALGADRRTPAASTTNGASLQHTRGMHSRNGSTAALRVELVEYRQPWQHAALPVRLVNKFERSAATDCQAVAMQVSPCCDASAACTDRRRKCETPAVHHQLDERSQFADSRSRWQAEGQLQQQVQETCSLSRCLRHRPSPDEQRHTRGTLAAPTNAPIKLRSAADARDQ